MVKTSNVALMVLIAFVVGFILGAVAIRKYNPVVSLPVVTIQRDTVTIRDTIRGEVPIPRKVEVIRHDTVRLEISPANGTVTPVDTLVPVDPQNAGDSPRTGQNGDVIIPISRKVYATTDYRAVVSGWRPSLDSIEVYRETQTITNTVTKMKKPRIAVIAGGGAGYTSDRHVVPWAGVGVGIVLWSK